MSRENVEIVRSALNAFKQDGIDELHPAMSDDLVIHRDQPDGATFHGKEGFVQVVADWIEDFDDWTLTPQEFLDVGESVVVRTHQTARGKTSGVEVESHIWFVYTMREGKIARLSFHFAEEDALEAAGLSG